MSERGRFGQTCDPTHGQPLRRGHRVHGSDGSRDTQDRVKQGLTDAAIDEPHALEGTYGAEGYAAAEHISIGEDLSAPPSAPENAAWQRVIAGPIPGKSTEIVFFREGWLRLRTGSKSGIDSEQLVELGFLDPKYSTRWQFHRLWLWVSGLSLACLLILGLGASVGLLGSSGNPGDSLALTVPVIGVVVIASMALPMLVRGARRSVTFVTRTGRVPAVRLTALPGRRAEIIVIGKKIREAIREAMPSAQNDASGNLRAEMQGHYRLRDAGVISAELCDEGTQRILAQFG